MSKQKRARPDLEWPWCDTCEMHCREIDKKPHACSPKATREPEQLTTFDRSA